MQCNRRASRACTCQRSLFAPFVHRFTTGPVCAACRSRASHCLPFAPLATRLLRCLRTRADDTAEKRRAVLEMAAGLMNGQRAFRSGRRCSYATTSSGFTGFSPGARMARTTTSSSRTTKRARYLRFRRVPKRRCRNSSENDGFSYAKPQERGKSRRRTRDFSKLSFSRRAKAGDCSAMVVSRRSKSAAALAVSLTRKLKT